MGVDTRRKPPLPAPTESSTLQTSDDNGPGTDLATDVSRRTDHTSYSIPEDGSPITVNTTKKRDKHGKNLEKSGHHSQTSLLIEYFEGGKTPNVHSRPSVRVKVTPSSARKGKENKDHIQITEGGGTRKPSYTRRISLGPKNAGETHLIEGDDHSVSSLAENSSLSGRLPPVEIEVMHKDQGSDLSGTSISNGSRYVAINQSEISAMPPDSMLGGKAEPATPRRTRSPDMSADDALVTTDTLKTPSRRRSRSLSRERITQKVIEKLGKDPGAIGRGKHKHGKSRSRSASQEQLKESLSSPRRRSSKHRHSGEVPSGESSLINASQVSDGRSFRSGTSRSSYNNPKLLEMVEDTVRRLILPEITALKAEQKTQTNLKKFERGNRDSVDSIDSREELTRKPSKHSSDPNVRGKPKVVLNRDENGPGLTLSGDSVKRKKGRHDEYYDSPSERSFERGMSEETVIRDGGKESRKRSKEGSRLRDTAAAAVVGGLLTHAALRHHDSKSSIERRERRRKRSKSHSRSHSLSTSVAETEEIFYKHDVPPMPMRSEITNSDLTRDSLLSERTSTPTSERRRAEIREVARASPKGVYSPEERTPTRSPAGLRGLGTHHKNNSRGDLSLHSAHSEEHLQEEKSHHYGEAALAGATVGAGLAGTRHAIEQYENRDENSYASRRGLSPIQSVASYEERDVSHEETTRRAHSAGSVSSVERHHEKDPRLSMRSISSVDSANVLRSNRPQGISLESGSEILGPHDLRNSNQELSRDPTNESWYDDNERYRDDSLRNSTVDVRHLTNYTDDSADAPYLDKVTAAQQIRGIGANAEYIHTPVAVESAVASLLDPSVVDVGSNRSGPSGLGETYLNSPESDVQHENYTRGNQSASNVAYGSPLKQQHDVVDQDLQTMSGNVYDRNASNSPKRSVPLLADGDSTGRLSAHNYPMDPLPEFLPGMKSPSDISTNPSDIQGPRRGPSYDTPIQWPYQKADSSQEQDYLARSNNTSTHESLKAAAANMLSAAAGAGAAAALAQRERHIKEGYDEVEVREVHDSYSDEDREYHQNTVEDHETGHTYPNGKTIPTPTMQKDDEGYQTEDPITRALGMHTPDNRPNGKELFPDESLSMGIPNVMGALGDPFLGENVRSTSANSHGMGSPLYDSATGTGLDRIQSKDIVALMNHLTVRDSQRNARDTEILVTLVRSAAEMRNSFEDMKRFIAEQDEILISVGNKQHEKTQRVIGGPRPQPAGTPRVPRRTSEDDLMDDLPAKRRNVFRRALKGLGGKNTNDLAKIEDMLNHLLDEVADLKAGQETRPTTTTPRGNGLTSYEQLRDTPIDGYEPEGQAGTLSNGNHSGYFSNPPSRQGSRQQGYDRRRASENRISTVLEEHDEDAEEAPLEPHEQDVLEYENTEHILTPTRDMPRGGSVPLHTPPAVHVPTGPQSNENTPRTDKSRKHKSSSSSFFPKISRWSKTTASSVADNVRGGARKERPFSGVSQSGSDLQNYDVNDHYDPQGDDRIRSNISFGNDRPPSPLIPSQVSEKPTYRAHRDSLNLQHPQPRQGPTARYQNHLESQVHDISSPISPSSDHFGSNPALARFGGGPSNRNSNGGNLSPISDRGYSEVSATQKSSAPARPAKIKDDGPLIPPKIPMDEKKPTFAERSAPAMEYSQANGTAIEPSSPTRPSPQRKPTGPRPITSSGSYSPDKVANLQKTRYRGSPNHIGSSSEDVTF